MLKRIAVFGGDQSLVEQVALHAQGQEIEAITPASPAELTAGTVGVIAAESALQQGIEAVGVLANWSLDTLYLLAEALDCREGFILGSSRRVMDHATRFAVAFGLDKDDTLTLARAALLRDIGKIRIPNPTLLKDGALNYEEWRLIQTHPVLGCEILSMCGSLRDTAEAVRFHHECYDGDGYPEGIEGEKIPLLARILKILDVYCAMTSPRHYRHGHSTHGGAVAYLKTEQGKHFDPALVNVFIEKDIGRVVD